MMKLGRTPLLETGALGSAIAASICCFGPLALALMGVGGGALLLKLAPLRPYFLAVTVLFLGGAFYVTYRRPEACATGSSCTPAGRRNQRIVLWLVTGIVVLAAAFPAWSGLLF